MITLRTFTTPEEAHLFRMRLEAAEIPAYVQFEHHVQMIWKHSNAIGGVRVQISELDAEEALEFLAQDTPQESAEAVPVYCTHCGSVDTQPDDWPRRFSLLCVLFLQLPVSLGKGQWKCHSCRRTFRPPATPREPEDTDPPPLNGLWAMLLSLPSLLLIAARLQGSSAQWGQSMGFAGAPSQSADMHYALALVSVVCPFSSILAILYLLVARGPLDARRWALLLLNAAGILLFLVMPELFHGYFAGGWRRG